jgi:ABC-type uncharacterized transport system auxiliary subunit
MRVRANGIRWQAIAILATTLASLVACVVTTSSSEAIRLPSSPSTAQCGPLDTSLRD